MTRGLLIAVLVLSSAGCGFRHHLTPGHGKSVRQAFATQAVRRQPFPPGTLPAGLDPDDARATNENYRVTLARKGADKKASAPGIIVVNEEEGRRAPRRE
jgi:hypothetical protein